jgi:hypothetical protein
MSAQTIMQLLPKMCNKDRSSIGDNCLWDTMIADNMRHIELGIQSDTVCSGYGYKVGWLSQAIHNDPYRVVPMRDAGQTHNEVYAYVFPFSLGNTQGL